MASNHINLKSPVAPVLTCWPDHIFTCIPYLAHEDAETYDLVFSGYLPEYQSNYHSTPSFEVVVDFYFDRAHHSMDDRW